MDVRKSNPVFEHISQSYVDSSSEVATYAGVSLKTTILFVVAVISGLLAINFAGESIIGLLVASSIIAFIAVLVGVRSVRFAQVAALVYAMAEGVLLGVITVLFEYMYPGIAFTAVLVTFAIFGTMLFLYSTGVIRVGNTFRKVMISTLFGILIVTLLSLFIPPLREAMYGVNSALALPLAGFLVLFGAFMLLLDFDRTTQMVSMGVDRRYEWMLALGLMVTIVWIYFQVLRLLAIIMSRRK